MERAQIALSPSGSRVENRGEAFSDCADAVKKWLDRPAVVQH
jgi:hypothetical protein